MRGAASPFPTVYRHHDTAQLLAVFEAGPARIRGGIEGLTRSDLRARPRPGKWSILEIVMHVCDSELVGAGRIRLTWCQPGSPLMGYNQDIWTEKLAHNAADSESLAGTLALFERLRETGLRILRQATAADWTKTGVHPEYGPITLRNLLELYADHSERHVEQIVDRRQLLGKPRDIPTLLTPRLY